MPEAISTEVSRQIGEEAKNLGDRLKGLTRFGKKEAGEEPMAETVVSEVAPKGEVAAAPVEAPAPGPTLESTTKPAVKVEVEEKRPKTAEDVLAEFEAKSTGVLKEAIEDSGLTVVDAKIAGLEASLQIKENCKKMIARLRTDIENLKGEKPTTQSGIEAIGVAVNEKRGVMRGFREEDRKRGRKRELVKDLKTLKTEREDKMQELKSKGIDIEGKDVVEFGGQLRECLTYLEYEKMQSQTMADLEEAITLRKQEMAEAADTWKRKGIIFREIRGLRAELDQLQREVESRMPAALKGFEGEAKSDVEKAFRQAVEDLKVVYEKPEEVATEPEAVAEVVENRQDELLTRAEEAAGEGDAAGAAEALLDAAVEGELSDEQKQRVAEVTKTDIEWDEERLKRGLEDPGGLEYVTQTVQALKDKGEKVSVLSGLLIRLVAVIVNEMAGQAGTEAQIADFLVGAEDIFGASGQPLPRPLEVIKNEYSKEVEAKIAERKEASTEE